MDTLLSNLHISQISFFFKPITTLQPSLYSSENLGLGMLRVLSMSHLLLWDLPCTSYAYAVLPQTLPLSPLHHAKHRKETDPTGQKCTPSWQRCASIFKSFISFITICFLVNMTLSFLESLNQNYLYLFYG